MTREESHLYNCLHNFGLEVASGKAAERKSKAEAVRLLAKIEDANRALPKPLSATELRKRYTAAVGYATEMWHPEKEEKA